MVRALPSHGRGHWSESSIAHPISEQKRGCLSQRITDRYSFEAAEEELLREATPAALALG